MVPFLITHGPNSELPDVIHFQHYLCSYLLILTTVTYGKIDSNVTQIFCFGTLPAPTVDAHL
jgi:hypothetical protein